MTGIITLLLDNAPAHPSSTELNAVHENFKVHFLPPNVTAFIQPMNQGIISLTKKNYKKNLLKRALFLALSTEQYLKNLNLSECFTLLSKAWENLNKSIPHKVWRAILGDSLINDQPDSVTEVSNNKELETSTNTIQESSNFLEQFGDQIVDFFPHESNFSGTDSRNHLLTWLNNAKKMNLAENRCKTIISFVTGGKLVTKPVSEIEEVNESSVDLETEKITPSWIFECLNIVKMYMDSDDFSQEHHTSIAQIKNIVVKEISESTSKSYFML